MTYEVDLGKKNWARLEKALARSSRLADERRAAAVAVAPAAPVGSPADRSAVRAWARAAGLKVSERGRISGDIMRQYDAAH